MGNIYRLGLLGHGISFSLSPKIHSHSAEILGLGCEYKLYDLESGAVAEFLKTFWQQGGHGLNVTTPHKELVANEVQSGLSSVNTLYRGDDSWNSASTDGEGFARAVAQMGCGLENYDDLVILGSGGASMAILAYLRAKGVTGKVHLFRRSPKKDEILQQELARELRFFDFDCASLESCLNDITHDRCLIIQASSAPIKGDDLSHLLPALKSFRGHLADLVYGKPSALLKYAQDQGLACQDGLPMLIEQARLAQELWWGESAGFEAIYNHLISGS